MNIYYLLSVILNETLRGVFFSLVFMLHRHRQKVNFHMQRNETDRLEKNGIDSDAATDCIERYKKKKKRESEREENFSSIFDYTN